MTDETTMLCPECYQPRGHCEHTEGESMFGPAQPAPDADHGDAPERKPTPQVGDRVQLNYGHPDYPGEVGTVAEVKPSRVDPEVNMVRVTFDVWVSEDELR